MFSGVTLGPEEKRHSMALPPYAGKTGMRGNALLNLANKKVEPEHF
jgi:hypothetical protein